MTGELKHSLLGGPISDATTRLVRLYAVTGLDKVDCFLFFLFYQVSVFSFGALDFVIVFCTSGSPYVWLLMTAFPTGWHVLSILSSQSALRVYTAARSPWFDSVLSPH